MQIGFIYRNQLKFGIIYLRFKWLFIEIKLNLMFNQNENIGYLLKRSYIYR